MQARTAFIHLPDTSCQARGNSVTALDIIAGMSDLRKQAAKCLQLISKPVNVQLPHGEQVQHVPVGTQAQLGASFWLLSVPN